MLKLLFTAATLTLLIGSLQAQDSTAFKLNSNRIGFTESSRAVDKGVFMIEGGFEYSVLNYIGYPSVQKKDILIKLPDLNLSYGVTRNLELRFSSNYYNYSHSIGDSTYQKYESNFFSLGAKLNLTNQKGILPEMAVLVNQKIINSAFSNRLLWSTEASLLWSYQIGKKFNLAGSFIYNYGNSFSDELISSVKLSYQINPKLGVYGEYSFEHRYKLSKVGLGIWYQVAPRVLFTLNASQGLPFNNILIYKPNNYSVSVGATFLLNNPDKKTGKKKRK